MEILAIIITLMSSVSLWFSVRLYFRLKSSVDKYSYRTELNTETKINIDAYIAKMVSSRKEEILSKMESKIEEYTINAALVDSDMTSINRDIKRQITDKYLKENLTEIMSKLDITAVSNAVLLNMTSDVLRGKSESNLHINEY